MRIEQVIYRAHETSARRRLAIWLFLLAIVVYLPGIFWGLPQANAPDRSRPWGLDEIAPFGMGEPYLAWKGDIKRTDPRYPLFHYMIQTLFCGPYLVWLFLSNQIQTLSREFPFGFHNPEVVLRNLTLIGRLPSLLMGAGVVAIACKTHPFRIRDWRLSALTGAFVLLITSMFYYSATSNVDVPALFWTALGLLVTWRILDGQFTRKRAIALGVFAALATATKDPNYTVFVSVLPAAFIYHWHRHRHDAVSRMELLKEPAVSVLTGAIVYALMSGLLLNPAWFMRHLSFIRHGSPFSALRGAYSSTPPTLESYFSATISGLQHLITSLGWPAMILVLLSLLFAVKRDRRSLIHALPVIGLFVGVIWPVRFALLRFVLPAAYVLAFFAAHGVWMLITARSRAARAFGILAACLALSLQAVKAADLTYQRLADQRYDLRGWFEQATRPGERVAIGAGNFYLPHLSNDLEIVEIPYDSKAAEFLQTERPEFVVVIPVNPNNSYRDPLLPEHVYQDLRKGTLGYNQVLGVRGPALLSAKPFPWVNPDVKVFVRSDLRSRIAPELVEIEIIN